MTAVEIARVLGAARRSGKWCSCRCPAHDDRSPSLSLRDGEYGLIVHCWAGCDPSEVLAELRRLGLLSNDRRDYHWYAKDRADDSHDRERRTEIARRIWNAAKDARGTPVDRYLAARGITAPLSPLRWAPSLRRPDGTHAPAIVARVNGLNGELIGVHRTWLDRNADGQWHRRDRASLGPVRGGAVRLAPAAETLLIAEGIETALAGMQATGLPAWAALSTSGMVALALPPSVRSVIILADHDRNGAGERAARTATQRWLAEGRSVRVYMSPHVGEDAADRVLATVDGKGRHAI
jgi:hypothetical protein